MHSSSQYSSGHRRLIEYATEEDGDKLSVKPLITHYDNMYNNSGTNCFAYTYDNFGNILSDGRGTYTYDVLNQLISASSVTNGNEELVETFSYDSHGNIQTKTTEYKMSGESLGSPTNWEYHYDNVWRDRLSSITKGEKTVRSYTYDEEVGITTPTSDGRFNFEWDGRQLISAERITEYMDQGMHVDYEYDAEGRRVQKTIWYTNCTSPERVRYFYSGDKLVSETKYSSTYNNETDRYDFYEIHRINYIYESTGLAFVVLELYNSNAYLSAGEYSFFVYRNAQGDITGLDGINCGGIRFNYSAYGEILYYDSGDAGDFMFNNMSLLYRGYCYDRETGLYYIQAESKQGRQLRHLQTTQEAQPLIPQL